MAKSVVNVDANDVLKAATDALVRIGEIRNEKLNKEIDIQMAPKFFGLIPGKSTREAALESLKNDDSFFSTYDSIMKIEYGQSEDTCKSLIKMAKYAIKNGKTMKLSMEDFDTIEDFLP